MSNDTPERKYGSDLIVDLLRHYDIPFAAINPGATFRGIHDSIVNYGDNKPEIIECPHEKIAMGVAHGYARVTGKPGCAIVHNVVGLLHGALGLYFAYMDRVPMLVLGGTGPMDASRRRPRVDWDHTALVQGGAVRDYVKWDDQPFGVDSIVDSFARGYRVANTLPKGPVYLCYDVTDQEAELTRDIPLPDRNRAHLYTPMHPDPAALKQAAALLVGARQPMIIADYVGPGAAEALTALAESLGAPVINLYSRFSLPNTHPLHFQQIALLKQADVVLALDVRDLYGCLVSVHHFNRQAAPNVQPDCKVIEIGAGDVAIKAWSAQYQRFVEADLAIMADAEVTIPALVEAVRESGGIPEAERVRRMNDWSSRKAEQTQAWQEQSRADWQASHPMTTGRLAQEIWSVIREKDWVHTGSTLAGWVTKLWEIDKPYRYTGKPLGTASQIGLALGAALAYRGSGKLVIDIQPDGDLMYDAGALWVATHHRIPLLVVMYNNRAYYNDWEHQRVVAQQRGRPVDRIHVGEEIDDPAPDFATLARSFGWYAEGPIEDPTQVAAAIRRAIEVIEREGRPALVDCVTRHR